MATTSAVGSAIWPYILAVVVGAGVVGGTLLFAFNSGTKHETSPETGVAVAPVNAPLEPVAPPSVAQTPSPASTQLTKAHAPATPASAHRPQDRLVAEVALLSRATRELRADRPSRAIEALDEYLRKFPKGLLSEEQRAARVQTMCALGRFDEAKAKLAGLEPQSPLAVQAKQFCDGRLTAR
jgi:hypothetical protein